MPDMGGKIRELRHGLGLQQKELAKAADLSQGRISQLENQKDGSKVDNAVLIKLARVLGAEVLEAANPSPGHKQTQMKGATLVALWRLRADVLHTLGMQGQSPDHQRLRKLSQSILRSAMRHPVGRPHSKDGELAGLRKLGGLLSEGERILIVSEVGWMKLDAPIHTDYSKSRAREFLIEISKSDLAIDVREEDFKNLIDRPLWRRLTSVGGPLGQVEALTCGDPDSLVLRGHDPVGWLGWPCVSGRWLVQTPSEYNEAALNQAAQVGANLTRANLGLPKWTDSQLAGIAVQRVNEWGEINRSSLDVSPAPLGASWLRGVEPAKADVKRASVLLLVEALGLHWVRLECNKIVTAYRIRARHGAAANEGPGLPPLPDAIESLQTTLEALVELKDAERQEGGAWENDKNTVLRSRQDAVKSVEKCLKSLIKLSQTQEGESS